MKILAIEREFPDIPSHAFKPFLMEESAQIWGLYQAGIIREAYFHANQPNAILIMESANVEAARQTLSTLPLVREGFIDFEIIPLVAYPGFFRLFSEEGKTAIRRDLE
jgi:hypothetical protein